MRVGLVALVVTRHIGVFRADVEAVAAGCGGRYRTAVEAGFAAYRNALAARSGGAGSKSAVAHDKVAVALQAGGGVDILLFSVINTRSGGAGSEAAAVLLEETVGRDGLFAVGSASGFNGAVGDDDGVFPTDRMALRCVYRNGAAQEADVVVREKASLAVGRRGRDAQAAAAAHADLPFREEGCSLVFISRSGAVGAPVLYGVAAGEDYVRALVALVVDGCAAHAGKGQVAQLNHLPAGAVEFEKARRGAAGKGVVDGIVT